MAITDEDLARLRSVKAAHETELMRKANVVGVGIGLRKREGESTDEPAIVVSVTRKIPSCQLDAQDEIPPDLEGVPVDVQAVGELRAL